MTSATSSSVADQLTAEAGAEPGDRVRVATGQATYEGVLMQRHGFSDEDILVLKLDSGYNVGLSLAEGDELERLETGGTPEPTQPDLPEGLEDLPDVALIGTGGTIASFVEYRTGAVYPATSPEELAAAVPEAFEHANLRPKVLLEAFSEDLDHTHWEAIADEIEAQFEAGVRGVVVTHGTDTLHFTAAALGCLFDQLPGPVVLVGAQRSSDRPSSDAATNLTHAVQLAAQAEAGEVVAVMHGTMGDEAWTIHPAGRVRKMHTSRRDAFQSLNAAPLGTITEKGVSWDREPRRPADQVERSGSFSDAVGMVWAYPGLTEDELEAAARDGLVIAGTGLGHVPSRLIPKIEALVEAGTTVVVASQCLNGRTNLRVYETGRELIRAGCVEAEDMLPETAFVKLAWALGTAGGDQEEALRLLTTPRGREMADRSTFHYPKGGGSDE